MSNGITLEMKPFAEKIARTNYHVECYFDEDNKTDIRERMMRVIRQSIEVDLHKNDMLS